MAKKECEACGRKLGLMNGKVKLKDGYICSDCYKKLGLSTADAKEIAKVGSMTLSELQSYAQRKGETYQEIENFKATSTVGQYAKFDDENQKMILLSKGHIVTKPSHYTLFRYDQIVDFELLEDGSTLAQGGIGRAAVGGLLFGGAGAIVGATTRKSKNVCTDLKVKITVKDYDNPAFYITLLSTETKKDSYLYKTSVKEAQDILSKLQLIVNERDSSTAASEQNFSQISAADELRKFKSLLDDGIITQEEFEAEKKKLL